MEIWPLLNVVEPPCPPPAPAIWLAMLEMLSAALVPLLSSCFSCLMEMAATPDMVGATAAAGAAGAL